MASAAMSHALVGHEKAAAAAEAKSSHSEEVRENAESSLKKGVLLM